MINQPTNHCQTDFYHFFLRAEILFCTYSPTYSNTHTHITSWLPWHRLDMAQTYPLNGPPLIRIKSKVSNKVIQLFSNQVFSLLSLFQFESLEPSFGDTHCHEN